MPEAEKKFINNAQIGQDQEDEATEAEIDINNNAVRRIIEGLKRWTKKKPK